MTPTAALLLCFARIPAVDVAMVLGTDEALRLTQSLLALHRQLSPDQE